MSDGQLLQAAAAAANQELPGTTQQTVPALPVALSRVDARQAIDVLGLRIGSRCEILWRAGETLDALASEWVRTIITIEDEYVDELGMRRFVTSFTHNGKIFDGSLPLEAPFEMASISRVREARDLASHLVRQRDSKPSPGEAAERAVLDKTMTARLNAHAHIDAHRGRVSREIPQSSGLRVPDELTEIMVGFYPHYWWALKDADPETTTNPEKVEKAWRQSLESARQFLATPMPKTQLRKQLYLTALENVVGLVYRPRPQSKSVWRLAFLNSFALLKEMFHVTWGAKAAENLHDKLVTAFEDGYLDIDELVRKNTPKSDEAAKNMTSDDGQKDRVQQAQLSSLVSRLEHLENRSHSFRGRGRGHGYRGRGRGTSNARTEP